MVRSDLANGNYSNINQTEVEALMKAEKNGDVKLPEQLRKESYGSIAVVKDGMEAWKEIQGTNDEELRGFVDKYKKKALSMFSDTEFNELSFEQRKQVLNSVGTESRLGTIFSKYVQSISGAAVAEEEFQRLSRNAFGGDLQNVNTQTLKTAFGTFINSVKSGVDKTIKSNYNAYPGTMADLAFQMNGIEDLDVEGMANNSNAKVVRVNKGTGQVQTADGNQRPMTPEERKQYGI